ncbi:cAMP-binding domain of CRP or a regulatory subunit of cAMP-dependent protein kinases [Chitinophaga ginsengisegetis]|uniref:cAMP-binding domain of CRP or a regulatory subunit of cAMP-dependent protein kinases n=1 Tax=Chitinophaga ginsengisegetis TaxID=393003 RepID=A0A1T5N6L5_9BACT|nr:Crp/Fnr family transcriptional regulator [Chitinophaga ginsengisegetis]SKC95678.1 cAMP-binding domain of CRP or a regulatory subunit of cAMP-dependent protein kinases [Chitinophaga ginsengisegetis]
MEYTFRKQIERIVSLTDTEFEYVLSFFVRKKYKRHQFVIQEGDPANYEYFVLSGLLKSYILDEGGKMHILQFAMEDWWLSDYTAYLTGMPATTFADCLENSELLGITKENKDKLCSEMHKMEHFFRVKSNYGYVALQRRILSLLCNDAQAKYRQLFELYPSLFQRVPKALLASYIGVSRETLSRLTISPDQD